MDWYVGPRVLCATTDDRGIRCQHTGIVCVRHLTTGTRRDGRAHCCTACFITRGERHDNEDDHDPETGDRSPRCAQHVNPAVLLAQYGPYQSAPPLPHAPINRALIYTLDDHAGSRDRTWIGVPPQHSGLPNHRDSRGPQYDVHTDYACADAAESADPHLRVGLRDPHTMPDDSSDDSRTSAPDLTIPSVAIRARTYDAGMAHLASHPEAARAATNAQSYAMESPAALRARIPPHLPTTAAHLAGHDDADTSDAGSATSTQTPGRALYNVIHQQQVAAGCTAHEAAAAAFAIYMEDDTRTCPDIPSACLHASPQSADSGEHDAGSQASDDTQNLAGFDTMRDDDLARAMSDATDSDAQADQPATDHDGDERPHDEDDDSDAHDSSEDDEAHGEPGPGATAKRMRCDGGSTDTAAASTTQAAGASTPTPPPLPLPTDTTTTGCCTPGCTRRALFARGPCCLSCPGAFGRGHQPCHSPSCDAEHAPTSPPPQPTLPAPTPIPTPGPTHPQVEPQQQPTQLRPSAPHPSHHEPQTSRAGRRGPSWNHALLAAAAIIAPAIREAYADAPRITARRVGRHERLTLLCGALLASAATSCLPTASSSPLPAPSGDGQHADDPPLTPDHTTAPTDLYLSETDDDHLDQDDDQSDDGDDPAPPRGTPPPPHLWRGRQ